MVRIIRSNMESPPLDRFAARVQKIQKAQWGRLTAPSAPEGSKGSKVSRSLRLQGLWWRLRRNYSLRYVPSPRPCGHTERSEESGYLPLVMPTSPLVH